MGITFHRVDEQWYEVYAAGVLVGCVYRDSDAWSYRSWFIEGIPQETAWGGVNASICKPRGFGTRQTAARHLAIMQSGKILAETSGEL